MKKSVYLTGACLLLFTAGSLLTGSMQSAGADSAGVNRSGKTAYAVSASGAEPGTETETEPGTETETERGTETETDPGTETEAETVNGTETELSPVRPEEAGLREGNYSFEGELAGGSGRAHFDGPLLLTVEEDGCFLTFTMSSPFYDYVLVNGERFEPLERDGNSAFRVPLVMLNEDFLFTADTTAMSEPHEIDYSVRIDLDMLTYLGDALP